MKKNLKEMTGVFEKALKKDEIANTVYDIVYGNYSEKDYNIITQYLDISKASFGKRGFNLIAFVGNRTIQQYFIDEDEEYLNINQTLSIYKHLSDLAKDKFNSLVRTVLTEFYKDLNF